MQEEVRQNFQAEREGKEMINQGMGEIPQNREETEGAKWKRHKKQQGKTQININGVI